MARIYQKWVKIIFLLTIGHRGQSKNIDRMYPIHLEHSFRLDTHEINLPMLEPIMLDGLYYKNLRLGYNGYIGAMNSNKDYRIIPIFLMNYDMSLEGGIVRYTEKEKGFFRQDLIAQTKELFNVDLHEPKCMLVTWDHMKPINSTLCYKVRTIYFSLTTWSADAIF